MHEAEDWWAVNRMHRDIAAALDDVLVRSHNLSLTWLEVLRAVVSHPQPCRVSDVGAAVTLSASRVCRVLHALEERGLVRRTSSPADARATEVQVTDDGRELYAGCQAAITTTLRRVLAEDISPDGIQALTAIAARVAETAAANR